ncbi:MAG: hypothetical protein ABUK01_12415 [Leptospirales bacterium]
MSIVLFILLILSVILVIFAFIYPLVIVSIILQTLIVVLAGFILRRRIKKKIGYFGTSMITLLHTSLLILMFFIFFSYSLKQHEEGDMDDIMIGLKHRVMRMVGMEPDETRKPDESTTQEKESEIEDPF